MGSNKLSRGHDERTLTLTPAADFHNADTFLKLVTKPPFSFPSEHYQHSRDSTQGPEPWPPLLHTHLSPWQRMPCSKSSERQLFTLCEQRRNYAGGGTQCLASSVRCQKPAEEIVNGSYWVSKLRGEGPFFLAKFERCFYGGCVHFRFYKLDTVRYIWNPLILKTKAESTI